jgi:glycerophosphoryl diester phosphodiesterase
MPKIIPSPKYQLIGHRGTGGLRPENTYCSFEHAAELGLNWIEFDVQLTKDEQWVVMHDATIERTTNGQGKISDYNLQELSNLQAGLWYTPPYPQQPIPTLAGTLELAAKLRLHCNIEIKGSELEPQKHVALMDNFMLTHPQFNFVEQMFSNFDLQFISIFAKSNPQLTIGYLVDYFTDQTIKIAQQNNFSSINCDVKTISLENIRSATNLQIPILLYTVNDPYLAQTWLAAGVSAIFTDRPDLLLPV